MAGACLEQTTWLRRNLAVRAAPGGTPDRDQTASPEPGKATNNGQSNNTNTDRDQTASPEPGKPTNNGQPIHNTDTAGCSPSSGPSIPTGDQGCNVNEYSMHATSFFILTSHPPLSLRILWLVSVMSISG